MKPQRDDRKLLFDTRRLMQATSYHTVIFVALAYKMTDKVEIEEANQEAGVLHEKFNETGRVPEYVESFCLDVMNGKIPIMNKKGVTLNKKKK